MCAAIMDRLPCQGKAQRMDCARRRYHTCEFTTSCFEDLSDSPTSCADPLAAQQDQSG